ncbi:hypothetical protein APSETT444_003958 [Aspergillus pseudonomiae]
MSSSGEKMLFHHYVNYVASIMMPFEHPWNPWKRHYPVVSLQYSESGEKALYHAILAHAAFNFANLGHDRQKMMQLAASNYNASIQYVNDSIQASGRDFDSTLAAIMTLMMAEVYSGNSSKWKHHLQGAWAFLLGSNCKEPWNESELVCFSTQSLLIVKIIGATCMTDSQTPTLMLPPSNESTSITVAKHMEAGRAVSSSLHSDLAFAALISSTPQFGFTIGAQRLILECISTITTVSQQMRSDGSPRAHITADRTVSQVLACLDFLQAGILDSSGGLEPSSEVNAPAPKLKFEELARYQLNAFIYATYIYLYRALLDVPPKRVAAYVSLIFDNITAFSAQSSGNFSLWPAFIAAVEAYTVRDLESSCRWLEQSTHFGLGNRLAVRSIVEEVWQRRDALCVESGIDPGLAAVDWRDVARDLGGKLVHTTIGCGEQGFPSAQPYLSHTPGELGASSEGHLRLTAVRSLASAHRHKNINLKCSRKICKALSSLSPALHVINLLSINTMAELVGVVSSAITFATFAVQVSKSVQTLKGYWDSIRDAPDDLKWLLREVEILGCIIADVDKDLSQGSVPLGLRDSQHVTQSLHLCEEAVECLESLCKDLLQGIGSSSRMRRSYQAARIILHERRTEKHISKLHSVVRLLMLSQQCYISLFFDFLRVGGDIHQIVDGKTLLIAFLEGYLASLLSLSESNQALWLGQEICHAGIRAWLKDMRTAGLDLEGLGAHEWRIWKSGKVQREFNGGFHRVTGIFYGPYPEDWYIWLLEPSDSFVGEFWALVERSAETMPGEWPSE